MPQVIHPDGGESFCEEDAVTITWASNDCCGDAVRLELMRAGQVCSTIAEETSNDGSFTWYADRGGAETEDYTIRVTDILTGGADLRPRSTSAPASPARW